MDVTNSIILIRLIIVDTFLPYLVNFGLVYWVVVVFRRISGV